jgi:hypothetical protein
MAGGIFPGKPFEFNLKCVIISLLLAGGYWTSPHKNIWVLFFLLWFPYIAIAWYDYMYDCQNKIQPTIVPFGRYIWLPFKPQGYKENFEKLSDSQIKLMDRVDHTVGWTALIILLVFINGKRILRR